jgi:DNA-binding CsgD family transcriptional regulator/catechol 2,3-dioxygenase-like lactoylglutathione lyase family enzyme
MSARASRGRPPHPDILTPAEWRIAQAVRHGMNNRLIARRQGRSLDAVKYHLANILQKLGLSSRAQLRHWSGAPADSPLSQRKPTMTSSVTIGPLGQISRSVGDIDAAVRWYGEVLGLPHLYTFGKLAFFDLGGMRLFLEEGSAGPQSVLYFRVDDIRSSHAALTARGVAFLGAPHMIHRHADGTEEWMAFFNDPDGRPLAIMSQVSA